jgi:hypothetical protein
LWTICGHREVSRGYDYKSRRDCTGWQTPDGGSIESCRFTWRRRSEATTPAIRALRTFCTSSSRADTARTRRRLLRLALAPAPLRERAGRLARDTGCGRCCGCVREREARIVRSRPPASSPLRVPIPPAPPPRSPLGCNHRGARWVESEGPAESEVNGLTLGPLRLLGRRCRQARGLP